MRYSYLEPPLTSERSSSSIPDPATETKAADLHPFRWYPHFCKRALDVAVVVIASPVLLPIVGGFALLLASAGGSSFVAQKRIGRDGKTFQCWKLRSRSRKAHTPLGRYLRRSGLDELPMLWNVFKGDMSLVGPRSLSPEQQRYYPAPTYQKLRPGITGNWHLRRLPATSFEERAVLDVVYAARIGFGYDMHILQQSMLRSFV